MHRRYDNLHTNIMITFNQDCVFVETLIPDNFCVNMMGYFMPSRPDNLRTNAAVTFGLGEKKVVENISPITSI